MTSTDLLASKDILHIIITNHRCRAVYIVYHKFIEVIRGVNEVEINAKFLHNYSICTFGGKYLESAPHYPTGAICCIIM